MATINAERNRLFALRSERGLSQRSLAQIAGITRQAVGAIESGRMQPTVGIALALARALDVTVEELFGSQESAAVHPTRSAAAVIAGRRVVYPLTQDYLAIEPAESIVPNVFLAGCDLAVGLLARHAFARSRNVRVLWLPMTNAEALQALMNARVHAAIVHGEVGPRSQKSLRKFARFQVATTEAGWLLAPGNPLNLRRASDLVRSKARLVNRPAGAGARRLLDEQLQRSKVEPGRIVGYDREVPGQLDTGRAIAQGFADAAIGTASVARVFALDFSPLREERCTLFIPRAALRTPEIHALLDALRSATYRRDLQALQSYDASKTGEQIA
jgi:putative molybdopterin biosynthesis protein